MEINQRISLFIGKSLKPGKTLLFLDEIQECPQAIMALRYFFEELPDLHIIGAGSLLEFALLSENFRMPVGRVQYLHLYPLSFNEFLHALKEHELSSYISDLENIVNLPVGLHDKLNDYLRKYFVVGGMPAVVNDYVANRDIPRCKKIQQSILDTYLDDFAKYARESKHKYLKKVFYSIPEMAGRKFVYSHIDREIKSRDLKDALELLETAGIVHRVRQTSGAGVPLSAGVHESFFKVIFLDVGLFYAISGIYSEVIREKELTAIFKGAVAEQFAGQQLIVCQTPFTKISLYYWGRKAKNSSAEIDYLIEQEGRVIPLEIKSGPTGHMRSMHLFIEKYRSQFGFKISQARFKKEDKIISLPLYAIEGFLKGRVFELQWISRLVD